VNSIHRFYLLIVFLLASTPLVWLTAQAGVGIPYFLLGSWGYFSGAFIHLGLMVLFPDYGFGYGGRWLVAPIYFFFFVIYLLGLMKLNNHLRRRIRFPFPIIPLAIHSGGFLLCLFLSEVTFGQESSPSVWHWVLPIVLVTAYFLLDWQLALRGKNPSTQIAGSGPLK